MTKMSQYAKVFIVGIFYFYYEKRIRESDSWKSKTYY